ncbi:MAG: polysaccharide pyruvyl transferase CsaB [Clostridia bacterium]|nr:polysaccharide pyruvyl transferase CsaB [Clostridia bacterium]
MQKKPLKILMTTMQMGFGGAETHIYELCRALSANGHEVTVASAGGAYADMLSAAGIRHITLPLNTKRPDAVLRSYRSLLRLCRKEKFDIVHAHARIPAFICGLLKRRLDFRYVSTAHWVFEINPLWRRIADWGQAQMAVSEDIKQYLIDNYGCFADRIFVTVNGIDTEAFSPSVSTAAVRAELGLSDSRHRIVTVSRMDESRGLAPLCLAKCAEPLLALYPDLEILVVGDGVLSAERNLLPDIRKIADDLRKKYGRQVIFTPGLRTDTAQLIGTGDLFVGASRAALEAMACGKPTVVAGNEGYIGILDERRRDIAAKTNYCCRGCGETTVEKLLEDLKILFSKTDGERAEIGKYCRRVISEDYSAARTARDYEEMYASLPAVSEKERGRILVSGYYGFGNAGDDSIAAGILSGIRAHDGRAKITVLCKHPKKSAKKYGVRTVDRFDLFAILREMRTASLFISGGGNLLQNATSSRSLFYYMALIRLAKRRGLKVYIYANGVGPIFGEKNERAVKSVLELADRITFREPQSIDYVASLGFDRSKILLSADPALSVRPATAPRVDYILRGVRGERFFAVSLRNFASLRSEEVDGVREDDFAAEMAKEIAAVAEHLHATPLYLVMQSSRDAALCRAVNASCAAPGYVLSGLTAAEITGVLSRCELVIAMRLHLLIYGAAAGKPLLGISYDKQVASMLDYMHCRAPLRVREITGDSLVRQVDAVLGKTVDRAQIERLRELADEDAKIAAEMGM